MDGVNIGTKLFSKPITSVLYPCHLLSLILIVFTAPTLFASSEIVSKKGIIDCL